MASTGANIEIAIQPPTAIGVNRWLSPPVVVRTRDRQLLEHYLSGSKQLFATAILYSSNMVDYSATLGGNWSCSAQLVMVHQTGGTNNNRAGRAGGGASAAPQEWLYFVFNPVSVGAEGLFYFKIVVSALSLSSPDGQQGGGAVSEVVGGRTTTQFSVLPDAPRHYRPSENAHML